MNRILLLIIVAATAAKGYCKNVGSNESTTACKRPGKGGLGAGDGYTTTDAADGTIIKVNGNTNTISPNEKAMINVSRTKLWVLNLRARPTQSNSIQAKPLRPIIPQTNNGSAFNFYLSSA